MQAAREAMLANLQLFIETPFSFIRLPAAKSRPVPPQPTP